MLAQGKCSTGDVDEPIVLENIRRLVNGHCHLDHHHSGYCRLAQISAERFRQEVSV
jgi:hypothetical protein